MSVTNRLVIRDERPGDEPAIHRVVVEAFGREAEADLVDLLRDAVGNPPNQSQEWISLVAVAEREIVGHILFTAVTIQGPTDSGGAGREKTGQRDTGPNRGLGLAPMAVLPAYQRTGVGSRLIEEGLVACRRTGSPLVVVLGHVDYYPGFGFIPAHELSLSCVYDVPPEAFMALELTPEAAAGITGVVRYRPEFDQV